jgi:hypothetical protein
MQKRASREDWGYGLVIVLACHTSGFDPQHHTHTHTHTHTHEALLQTVGSLQPRRQPSPAPTHDLGPPATRTVKNKFSFLTSHQVYDILF